MSAGRYSTTIEQGATWTRTLTVKDDGVVRDLTGYSARLKARTSPDADPVIDISTSGSGISITPAAGQIVLTLTATETAALNFSTLAYDLEIEDGSGTVTRLLQGYLTLEREMTK